MASISTICLAGYGASQGWLTSPGYSRYDIEPFTGCKTLTVLLEFNSHLCSLKYLAHNLPGALYPFRGLSSTSATVAIYHDAYELRCDWGPPYAHADPEAFAGICQAVEHELLTKRPNQSIQHTQGEVIELSDSEDGDNEGSDSEGRDGS